MEEKYKPSDYICGFLMLLLWPIIVALIFWGLMTILEPIAKNISVTEFTLGVVILIALYTFQKNR